MKSAPFDYHRATSLDEVCALLDGTDDDRMIIAGGQTLVPLMAMRLARPTLLIDINEIAELAGIEQRDGELLIRACTRQAEALASPLVSSHLPLLAKALAFVGHQQTRNRGTVGGSVALGDPSAEIPLVAVALGATIRLKSARGERDLDAEDFFIASMMTAREPTECITGVSFPVWSGPGSIGIGFEEVSERHGDFAVAAAAVQLLVDEAGVCRRAAAAVGGAAPIPSRAAEVEAALVGSNPDATTAKNASRRLAGIVDPDGDGHASADYRRRVIPVLVERAILAAAEDASRRGAGA